MRAVARTQESHEKVRSTRVLVPVPRTPHCANRITRFVISFISPRSGQRALEKPKLHSGKIIHPIRMVPTAEIPICREFESLPGKQ